MTADVRMYRVFNRRMISELMLADQMRQQSGSLTVPELIALCGLPAETDLRQIYALCAKHSVPVRRQLPGSITNYKPSAADRENRARVAIANTARMAEIEQARREASSAPLYRPGSAI